MAKIKARCSFGGCNERYKIQIVDAGTTICPHCGNGGSTWKIMKPKPKFGLKGIVAIVLLLLIIVVMVMWCYDNHDNHVIKLNSPNSRTIKVGDTDTLRATFNEGDSVVWSVAIGDSLVSVVAINDSMCVVKALKEGQKAVVIASLLDYPEVRDTCVYVVKPVEIVSPDTIVVKKDSIPDDRVKATKPVVDSHAEGKVIDKPQPPTIESKTATIDLGYAIYSGDATLVNGKWIPNGWGELEFTQRKLVYGGKYAEKGYKIRNARYDKGKLQSGRLYDADQNSVIFVKQDNNL